MRFGVVAMAVILVFVLLPGTAEAQPRFRPPGQQQLLVTYLETQAETGPAFLSHNPNASSVSVFKPADAGPASGAVNHATFVPDRRGQTWEFKAGAPLDRVYYVNVSSSVSGSLHWATSQHTAGSTTQGDYENVRFRIELFSGNRRIGVSETMYQFYPVDGFARVTAGWSQTGFGFRPELHRLEKDEVLRLRVTRLQGFADFWIGTQAPHQSFFTIPYFDQDPLANVFYLENGFLNAIDGSQPAGEDAGAADPSPRPAGLPLEGSAALAAVGFLPPRLRRRSSAVLLLLLASSLAGCMGGGSREDGATPSSTPPTQAETGFVPEPGLEERGVGELHGAVLDGERAGVPLDKAIVIVLGTNRFANPGADGRYEFLNMTPGHFSIKVDRDGYVGVEHTVEVRAGGVTYLNLTLYAKGSSIVDRPAFDRPHVHDDWGGETRKQFQSFTFTPTDTITRTGPFNCFYFFPTYCNLVVPIDASKAILPGTVNVEVKLSWQGGPHIANHWGLMAFTSSHTFNPLVPDNGGYSFGPRESGQVFRIPIYPFDADPGHQNFTNWHFTLRHLTASSAWNPAYAALTAGTINVEMWMEKGVVPLEPKHRRFWEDNSSVELFREKVLTETSLCDNPSPGRSWRLDLEPGLFVPPGTREIRGWMNWTANLHPAPAAWSLVVKGANYPKGDADPKWFRVADESTTAGTSVAFVIRPGTFETDKYYQKTSYWTFAPSDGKTPGPWFSGCHSQVNRIPYAESSTTFRLTATAYRDPTYVEA